MSNQLAGSTPASSSFTKVEKASETSELRDGLNKEHLIKCHAEMKLNCISQSGKINQGVRANTYDIALKLLIFQQENRGLVSTA